MRELGEALFKALFITTDRPRFERVYRMRLGTAGSTLAVWIKGARGETEWTAQDVAFEGSPKAALWMDLDSDSYELSLKDEEGGLYVFGKALKEPGSSRLKGPALTGSPPPLVLSLKRFARFLGEIADLLGPTPENPPFREVGKNLALLTSLLEEHGEDLGLFAKGPFRLARGKEGAVLWNAETHELGEALEELLQRRSYEGPLPRHPQIRVRLAFKGDPRRPWNLSVRPLALKISDVAFSPQEAASVKVFTKANWQTVTKDLLEPFGVKSYELDLLEKEGPEALAKALALRRVAEL